MKTKEQILDWLDKQPWKGEFYEEVFLNESRDQIFYDESFIINAFCWSVTKAGLNAWAKRNLDFSCWYDANDRPMSWKEYCKQNPIKAGDSYMDEFSAITIIEKSRDRDEDDDVNVMPKDLCEAFLAYMKLIQLRNAWVKDCENGDKDEYRKIVYTEERGFYTGYSGKTGLSFPKLSMAEEFINTFKDLLEVAKPLI